MLNQRSIAYDFLFCIPQGVPLNSVGEDWKMSPIFLIQRCGAGV